MSRRLKKHWPVWLAAFAALALVVTFSFGQHSGSGGWRQEAGTGGGGGTTIYDNDTTYNYFSAADTLPATTFPVITGYGIFVDNTDPNTMWDLAAFRAAEMSSSQYDSLGPIPTYMEIWLSAGRDSLYVLDRADATTPTWGLAVAGASRMLPASPGLNRAAYKDGVLWLAGFDMCAVKVDFMTGKVIQVKMDGVYEFGAGLERWNTAAGYEKLADSSFAASVGDSDMVDVAVLRDPFMKRDTYGRPVQYVAFAASHGMSLYDPYTNKTYKADSTSGRWDVEFTPRGALWSLGRDGTRHNVWWSTTVLGIKANSFRRDISFSNLAPRARYVKWNDADSTSVLCVAERANPTLAGQPKLVWAGPHGARVGELTSFKPWPDQSDTLTLWTKIGDLRNYPPVADTGYTWSLDDTLEGWRFGYDITRTGAGATFGAGTVGKAMHLNGTDYASKLAMAGHNHNSFTVAFACSTADTTAYLIYLRNTAGTTLLDMNSKVSGLRIDYNDGSGADSLLYAGPSPKFGIADGKWHSLVFSRNLVDRWCRLYVDGELVAKDSVTSFDIAFGPTRMYLGASDAGARTLTGALDELTIWTNHAADLTDARYLHLRALAGHNSNIDPNDALNDTMVTDGEINSNGTFALSARDSVTFFTSTNIPVARVGAPDTIVSFSFVKTRATFPAISMRHQAGVKWANIADSSIIEESMLDWQPDLTAIQLANPCILDSSGREGVFFDNPLYRKTDIVDACTKSGDFELEVRPGTYGPITIATPGFGIVGEGRRSLFWSPKHTTVVDCTMVVSRASKFRLQNVAVAKEADASGIAGSRNYHAIFIDNADSADIDGIFIPQTDGVGIVADSSSNIRIINIRIDDYDYEGITFQGVSKRTVVHGCWIGLSAATGASFAINTFAGNDISVINDNIVYGNVSAGSLNFNAGSDSNVVVGNWFRYAADTVGTTHGFTNFIQTP